MWGGEMQGLLVPQDPVHGRAAHGALPPSGPAPILHGDLFAIELPLRLALHAVGLVLRHVLISSASPAPGVDDGPAQDTVRGRQADGLWINCGWGTGGRQVPGSTVAPSPPSTSRGTGRP